MSKFKDAVMPSIISFTAWIIIHFLCHSSRYKVEGFENVKQLIKSGQGFILSVWHGRTMLPIHYCRGRGIWAIVSISKDGELQKRTISRFGYKSIRGSTGRTGLKAALTAVKKLQEGGILAITPDGSRGPTNIVQEGIVFLAKKSQVPIIPIGVGINRRKLLRSWDSYAIPKPFCKCGLIFGEPISFNDSEGSSDSEIETLQAAMRDVQHRAQQMVKEG